MNPEQSFADAFSETSRSERSVFRCWMRPQLSSETLCENPSVLSTSQERWSYTRRGGKYECHTDPLLMLLQRHLYSALGYGIAPVGYRNTLWWFRHFVPFSRLLDLLRDLDPVPDPVKHYRLLGAVRDFVVRFTPDQQVLSIDEALCSMAENWRECCADFVGWCEEGDVPPRYRDYRDRVDPVDECTKPYPSHCSIGTLGPLLLLIEQGHSILSWCLRYSDPALAFAERWPVDPSLHHRFLRFLGDEVYGERAKKPVPCPVFARLLERERERR